MLHEINEIKLKKQNYGWTPTTPIKYFINTLLTISLFNFVNYTFKWRWVLQIKVKIWVYGQCDRIVMWYILGGYLAGFVLWLGYCAAK